MDDAVLRSMQKWPSVPAVYGWLRLDRRGGWRIRAGTAGDGPVYEPIGNAALRQFVGRNYAADERGRWYFQNGPQRVYVGLEYTPFVFSRGEGEFVDQCGLGARKVDAAWLDDEGALLLQCGGRLGVLDDRDLAALADNLVEGFLPTAGGRITVGSLYRGAVAGRFGFVTDPQP